MNITANLQEEDRFHPSCILSVMTQQPLPPYGAIGLTELLTYMLDGARNNHACENGMIHGFNFNVLPRIAVALPYLQKQFPEMAAYAESLSPTKLRLLRFSKHLSSMWIMDIEKKFGQSIQVKPIEQQEIHDAQLAVVTNQLAYIDKNKPLFAIWWTISKTKDATLPTQTLTNHPADNMFMRAKL